MKVSQSYKNAVFNKLKKSGLDDTAFKIVADALNSSRAKKTYSLSKVHIQKINDKLNADNPVVVKVSKTGKIVIWNYSGLEVRQAHARKYSSKAREARIANLQELSIAVPSVQGRVEVAK